MNSSTDKSIYILWKCGTPDSNHPFALRRYEYSARRRRYKCKDPAIVNSTLRSVKQWKMHFLVETGENIWIPKERKKISFGDYLTFKKTKLKKFFTIA